MSFLLFVSPRRSITFPPQAVLSPAKAGCEIYQLHDPSTKVLGFFQMVR
jgi:hypothetical protein